MCEAMRTETKGCIGVTVRETGRGECTAICSAPGTLQANDVAGYSTVSATGLSSDMHVFGMQAGSVYGQPLRQSVSLSCGLVCGTDIGLPVLFASDGALITINGEYLLVQ